MTMILLMVSGFIGTLIGLERAVSISKPARPAGVESSRTGNFSHSAKAAREMDQPFSPAAICSEDPSPNHWFDQSAALKGRTSDGRIQSGIGVARSNHSSAKRQVFCRLISMHRGG